MYYLVLFMLLCACDCVLIFSVKKDDPPKVENTDDPIVYDGLKILSYIIARRHIALTKEAGKTSFLSNSDDNILDKEENQDAGA